MRAPPRTTWPLLDLDFNGENLVLDFFEKRMAAQAMEVGVLHQPFEVAVALLDGAAQSADGPLIAFGQRVAAGQVVEHGRVLREQSGQLFVDLQAIVKLAPSRVIVPQNLQGLDKSRI